MTGLGYSGHGEILLDGAGATEHSDFALTSLVKVQLRLFLSLIFLFVKLITVLSGEIPLRLI